MDLFHVCFGGLGGHSGVVQPLTKELSSRGIRSVVCLYAPVGELVNAPSWSSFGSVVKVEKLGRVDPVGLGRIANTIRRARPRVVVCHTQNPVAPAVFGQLLGGAWPRVVLAEHQSIGLRSKGTQAKSLLALILSRAVVVLTRDYAERYPFRAVPIRAVHEMTIVPNGVDLDLFRPKMPLDPKIGGPRLEEDVVVGMASRLSPTKDVVTLIEAISLLNMELEGSNRFHLKIAGDGSERIRLQEFVDRLNLSERVTFCGSLGEQDLVGFLRSLDIYVQSTLGETLSTAILQAYAVGLPVVASDVEGVRNLIRDKEDGILVGGGSSGLLANGLAQLARDPMLRASLAQAARSRAVADFSASLMTERYLDLLTRIDPMGPWAEARTRSCRPPKPGGASTYDPADEI